MVTEQIARRGIHDPRLISALESIPRHHFVLHEHEHLAYADCALPIGEGQTISQPYIVALMTNLLGLGGNETVLEVGTGSGYQAAILSQMAGEVHTVELIEKLAARARSLLLPYQNVHCHEGDGSLGWSQAAPYDAIIVTAAAPSVPEVLLDQLKDHGRLILPVGGAGLQTLELWTRRGEKFMRSPEIGVAFVPLRGKHGW